MLYGRRLLTSGSEHRLCIGFWEQEVSAWVEHNNLLKWPSEMQLFMLELKALITSPPISLFFSTIKVLPSLQSHLLFVPSSSLCQSCVISCSSLSLQSCSPSVNLVFSSSTCSLLFNLYIHHRCFNNLSIPLCFSSSSSSIPLKASSLCEWVWG